VSNIWNQATTIRAIFHIRFSGHTWTDWYRHFAGWSLPDETYKDEVRGWLCTWKNFRHDQSHLPSMPSQKRALKAVAPIAMNQLLSGVGYITPIVSQ